MGSKWTQRTSTIWECSTWSCKSRVQSQTSAIHGKLEAESEGTFFSELQPTVDCKLKSKPENSFFADLYLIIHGKLECKSKTAISSDLSTSKLWSEYKK
jgi:hypothetical protein